MISFSIHFLFCNLFISIIIGMILLFRKFSEKHVSGCGQYRIWFLLPVILAVPFLSVRPRGFSRLMLWLRSMQVILLSERTEAPLLPTARSYPQTSWMNDFSVSVTGNSASLAGFLFSLFWICGMLVMTILMIRAGFLLYRLEQSALPLQSRRVRALYVKCREEMQIRRNIPVYSTAFLKSPVIVGALRPRIYLPVHLISDLNETDMRYMLLHELQHYRHRDALLNLLLNLAAVVYWFNPVVWFALREARADREIACDTSVLQMLDEDDHIGYGNTLLNFAQKTSRSPFFPAAGIGGSARQIRKRILNIALYRPLTGKGKVRERVLLAILTGLILESTAVIPVLGADTRASLPENALIHREDLSGFFDGYDGCFVLYDQSADVLEIYNEDLATRRFSPDSTYKIYSALLALENRTITPASSTLRWDGQTYPFPEWNREQDLTSAMKNTVNWYFQELDQRAGSDALKEFYRAIDYGNQDLSGGVSQFWMESSLKISALEQVELLRKLCANEFHFDHRNVQAVKDALKLTTSGASVLSGKTGSGVIDGKSVNGWFIGYVESDSGTFFFATNIQGPDQADGLRAGEITLDILAYKGIYG